MKKSQQTVLNLLKNSRIVTTQEQNGAVFLCRREKRADSVVAICSCYCADCGIIRSDRRLRLFYDLYLKMTLWGDQIRHADDEISLSTRGPQNLMELLPAEFTIEDAQRVRQQRGLDASQRATAHMIRTWRNRGYCAQRTAHSFKKV